MRGKSVRTGGGSTDPLRTRHVEVEVAGDVTVLDGLESHMEPTQSSVSKFQF